MKNIKRIVSLIVALLLVSVLVKPLTHSMAADESWAKVEASGKLIVATSGTLYPNAFYKEVEENGKKEKKLVGYDIDILREVAKRLNLELEFKEMQVDGMLQSIETGQADILANGFDITPKREEKFLFSTPIKYSFGSTIVRQSDDSGIKSLDDFAGKKAGGGATTNFMKIAEAKGAEPVVYDNATNDVYLRDVENGRTDFIPHDYYIQSAAVKYFSDIKVKVGDVFYNPNKSAFVYNKASVSLKEKIDEQLEVLRKEGFLKSVSESYFGADASVEKDEINGIKISDLPVVEVE
ncbi:transporter substrate-binding domain-containing protein [Aerococcaceae bacterium NML190073]|nr:transporter substrate-binding domain-containing protein [Aerococcaceae bacterium NML190073]MCW6666350.1 transporter substrate-binding domain-containing protein [Aerococcaceae bacterium NML190938]